MESRAPVEQCELDRISGHRLWTHEFYLSPELLEKLRRKIGGTGDVENTKFAKFGGGGGGRIVGGPKGGAKPRTLGKNTSS